MSYAGLKRFQHAHHQNGGAMLVMLVILVIGITTAFVASLSSTSISNQRNNTTAEALARAKEALIGYAVTYGDINPLKPYGLLPCPDSNGSLPANGEGSSELCGTTNVNVIGRFPWRTLDLPALFDGTGECFWYALSGNYKNTLTTPPTMNWDNAGQLQIFDSNGNEIAPGEIVAVVIAPGTPVNGNSDRSGNNAPTCGGNFTASAYLDNDTDHGIDNSNIALGQFIMPHEHRDANGNITLTVNDQFIYITRQDIWYAIENRIARDVRKCLDAYAATSGGKYPWAVPVTSAPYVGSVNTRFGRIPDSPNINTPYSSADPQINDMLDYLEALQIALDNFAANDTPATRSALDTAGDNLNDTADDILDAGTYPGNIEDVATPAKYAGSRAEHLAAGDTSQPFYTVSGVQFRIDQANAAIDALPTSPDATMDASWPAGCFSAGTYWDHWKELVFYQVASDYQPGGAADDCLVGGVNSCLSLQYSDQAQPGSGTYRAAVVIAGKKIGGGVRNAATLGDYLEAINQTPMADNFQPYNTYRVTDSNYQTINDRVLCVDAGVNCN